MFHVEDVDAGDLVHLVAVEAVMGDVVVAFRHVDEAIAAVADFIGKDERADAGDVGLESDGEQVGHCAKVETVVHAALAAHAARRAETRCTRISWAVRWSVGACGLRGGEERDTAFQSRIEDMYSSNAAGRRHRNAVQRGRLFQHEIEDALVIAFPALSDGTGRRRGSYGEKAVEYGPRIGFLGGGR